MATLYVPLTHGKVALIDEADGPLVLARRWRAYFRINGDCYAVQRGDGSEGFDGLRMHRLIMNAKPGEMVDHIDGNGLNNKRSNNLRICDRSANMHNLRGLPKKNKTGFIGVVYRAKPNRWYAHIAIDRKTTYLGAFGTKEEAALAYDAAARAAFGTLTRFNFPLPGERGIRSGEAA